MYYKFLGLKGWEIESPSIIFVYFCVVRVSWIIFSTQKDHVPIMEAVVLDKIMDVQLLDQR